MTIALLAMWLVSGILCTFFTRIIEADTMKLSIRLLLAFGLCCSIAFGDADVNKLLVKSADPSTDMICNPGAGMGNQPIANTNFCGTKGVSFGYDATSCFETVAQNGCKIINKNNGVNCEWGAIYAELQSKPSLDYICNDIEGGWCQQHGGTAAQCKAITDSCRNYDQYFFDKCLPSA